MHSVRPDQYYTDVIARPITGLGRKQQASKEIEVIAEDEQHFLTRHQLFLQQGGTPPSGGSIPAGVQKTPDRKVVGSPGVQGSPKKMEVTPGKPLGANTSEGVLANFFNSLLSKKTGGGIAAGVAVPPGQGGTSPGARSGVSPQPDEYKAAVRSDAAAELDRLTRNQKKSLASPNLTSDGQSQSEC